LQLRTISLSPMNASRKCVPNSTSCLYQHDLIMTLRLRDLFYNSQVLYCTILYNTVPTFGFAAPSSSCPRLHLLVQLVFSKKVRKTVLYCTKHLCNQALSTKSNMNLQYLSPKVAPSRHASSIPSRSSSVLFALTSTPRLEKTRASQLCILC